MYVVESGDEVEVTKLPHGAWPKGLAGASEPHVLGLRACLDLSQMVENVVAVPKIATGGLLSGTEERCSRNVVILLVSVIPSGARLLKVVVSHARTSSLARCAFRCHVTMGTRLLPVSLPCVLRPSV